MSQASSPFKFLDSYQQQDANVFFGREKETTDLYNALSGVKHLMVYGPSGSGKTSLVECGLRNQFSDADWFAITIRKGADINASVFTSINNALHEKIAVDPLTKMPADPQIEFGQAIEKLFAERYQPVYLLFDQFEELLISGNTEEKKKFFTLLDKLIRNKIPCRIMLIMREEFIGHLSEFEPLCPSIFQHRFRVEKMGRKNVEEVILKILEAPVYQTYFTVDDSRKLTESILSKLPDKKKEIELAHVQVFLGELWDRAKLTQKINSLPVLSANLIRDNDNLESVLESFLKKQMSELEETYGQKVPLELLAAMISERFTKLQVGETDLQKDLEHKKVVSTKPIADLLRELEQRRIIRTAKIGDETQYEISHDVLALVVGQNLTQEMKMREKAGDVYKVYLEGKGFLTQDTLDELRAFQQILSYPVALQARIDESIINIKKQREEELSRTRKRLLTVYGLLGLALLALIVAGYYWNEANDAKDHAVTQTKKIQALYAKNLISEANKVLVDNPTLALRKVEQAMSMSNDTGFEKIENKIYAENSFYKIIGHHTNLIISVAFSPNGQRILTGSCDSTACLWDLKGNLLHTFAGHKDTVWSVKFSPHGDRILTGSGDSTARLWDLKGNLLKIFTGDSSGKVYSVAFSPNEQTILTGSADSTARLWNLGGKRLQKFSYHKTSSGHRGHEAAINSVTFSSDGKRILTGSDDGTALLWDLNGKDIRTFEVDKNKKKGYPVSKDKREVYSVAFSPNGQTILTGSADGTARLWDLNGDSLQEFKGHSEAIASLVFSPDGKTILTGSWDKTARLWSLNGNTLQEFKGHFAGVGAVAFSPDGKTILTGSEDSTARLWQLTGRIVHEFGDHFNIVSSVAFSPTGDNILTGSWDDTVRLWSLNGELLNSSEGSYRAVRAASFSPNGKRILMGFADNTARMWDLNGDSVRTFKDHSGEVNSVAFSPNGQTILTGSFDSTARLWDLLKEKTLHVFKGHLGAVSSVAFSPNGQTILTGSRDKTARLWNLKGDSLLTFKGHTKEVWSVKFSPDGKTILTGSNDGTACLWDLKGNQIQKFEGGFNGVTSVAFSPDGKTILAGSYKTALLWDLKGNILQEFKGHSDWVSSVAFSPDGKTVLTGSEDKTALLWKVELAMPVKDFLESDCIEQLTPEQKTTIWDQVININKKPIKPKSTFK